jgi:D-inositol-3-phosphate glycosyltransferase
MFGQARVVAVPYVRAMQSGVAHLAYGFGRPVVGSDVGDIPSVVRNGENGILVPPRNPGELAEALLMPLADPAFASRLGAAGRQRVQRESSWAVVAAKVEDGLIDLDLAPRTP